MAYCKKCGAEIPDGAKSCPKCGAGTASEFLNKVNDLWEDFNDTDDFSHNMNKNDISDNKLMALLSYLWLLVLIPLFANKNSDFVRFHTNQGLVLLICNAIIGILSLIPVIRIAAALLEIVAFIIMIIGIINVANGKAKELPIIGKIRLIR